MPVGGDFGTGGGTSSGVGRAAGVPAKKRAAVGLRERKKAKTRAAIQHEALRLFRERGYEATTVEQIADAVEVSPSTLFRYFPSKEDLVLTDEYDPLIVEAVRAQPSQIGPAEALRRALGTVLSQLGDQQLADMRQRAELAFAVPELRATLLDQLAQTARQVAALVAERASHPPDDFATQTEAWAILGVMIGAELFWVEHPGTDLFTLVDGALKGLAATYPH
jgi:AcrR family transcriptional regulator